MSIVNFSKVTHQFGGFNILKEISFTVEKNSKFGLIGKNGTGKTTIFNLIMNQFSPSYGDIFVSNKFKIIHLKQEPKLTNNESLYKFVLHSLEEFVSIKKKISELEELMQTDYSNEIMEKYNKVLTRFETIDGFNTENKVEHILTNLKFEKSSWEQSVSSFSGGEQTRIQLAQTLMQEYDLLLLDEPTNHLDLSMIYWFEQFLNKLEKPYIIISHDRDFLDKTVSRIIEIKNLKLNFYGGNYSKYILERDKAELEQGRKFKQQQKFLKKEQDFIQKNMAGQKVGQAKSRLKRLEKIEVIDKVTQSKNINLQIKSEGRSGNDVFRFENLSFGYDKDLFQKFSAVFHFQDKIAILGENGCGKSTLLKIIIGELSPTFGKVAIGANISLAYYDQQHIALQDDLTVEEAILKLNPSMTKGEVYSYMARFGFFEEDWTKKIVSLSGGEKARLYIAKLIFQKPNVLLLDEPTNHLDINMIESLELALKNFNGTIVFVSHDRRFIRNVADRVFIFRNKIINEIFGDFEKELLKKNDKLKKRKKGKSKELSNKVNPSILLNLESKMNDLTNEIVNLKKEIFELHEKFGDEKIYSNAEKLLNLKSAIALKEEKLSSQKTNLEKLEMEYIELLE